MVLVQCQGKRQGPWASCLFFNFIFLFRYHKAIWGYISNRYSCSFIQFQHKVVRILVDRVE